MKISTLLFTSSFVAVAASGWARLDAGSEDQGPDRQPALHRVTIGDQVVALRLDRERVQVGEPVRLTLSASERATVDVKIALLEQMGSPMSRVMQPPREVSSQVVHLAGSSVELPLTLTTRTGGDPLATAGQTHRYTIQVTPADPDVPSDGAWLPVFAEEPAAYRLTVQALPAVAIGEPVTVAIAVDSLASKPITDLTVGVGGSFLEVLEAGHLDRLAPGGHALVTVRARRVAPPDDAPLRIDATGWAGHGGTAAAWATVDLDTGALIARASEASPDRLELIGMMGQ